MKRFAYRFRRHVTAQITGLHFFLWLFGVGFFQAANANVVNVVQNYIFPGKTPLLLTGRFKPCPFTVKSALLKTRTSACKKGYNCVLALKLVSIYLPCRRIIHFFRIIVCGSRYTSLIHLRIRKFQPAILHYSLHREVSNSKVNFLETWYYKVNKIHIALKCFGHKVELQVIIYLYLKINNENFHWTATNSYKETVIRSKFTRLDKSF